MDGGTAAVPALDGVRVLDLTHHIAGPHCTKLLADYGADVIKVERPPWGDPARMMPPFFGNTPHPEGSALFLHLNTNKRSAVLDLKHPEGRAAARALAARADIVVESFRPGTIDRLGLGYDTLRALNPAAVVVSISNFGQDGPYRDLRTSEIVAYAMGGAMQSTGHRSREPLKLGGNIVQYHAGATAAFAAMAALWRAEEDGAGEHVDVSLYESQAGSRDRRTVLLTAYAYSGFTFTRAETAERIGAGMRPTADGYIDIAGYGARLPGLLRMIGRDDLLDDPRVADQRFHTDPAFVEEVETSYLAWLVQRGKADALAAAQAQRLIGGVVNTIADLFTDPHMVERAPWDQIDHPHTGAVTYPGRPFMMSESPRRPPRRAPLLGEHTRDVLADDLGYDHGRIARLVGMGAALLGTADGIECAGQGRCDD